MNGTSVLFLVVIKYEGGKFKRGYILGSLFYFDVVFQMLKFLKHWVFVRCPQGYVLKMEAKNIDTCEKQTLKNYNCVKY